MYYISMSWYPDIQGTPTWVRRLGAVLETMRKEANEEISRATQARAQEALVRLGISPEPVAIELDELDIFEF